MGRGRERERDKGAARHFERPALHPDAQWFGQNSPPCAAAEATAACTTRREHAEADGTFSPGNRKKLHHFFKLRWSDTVMPLHANKQVKVFFLPFRRTCCLPKAFCWRTVLERIPCFCVTHLPQCTEWKLSWTVMPFSFSLCWSLSLAPSWIDWAAIEKGSRHCVRGTGDVVDSPAEGDGQLPSDSCRWAVKWHSSMFWIAWSTTTGACSVICTAPGAIRSVSCQFLLGPRWITQRQGPSTLTFLSMSDISLSDARNHNVPSWFHTLWWLSTVVVHSGKGLSLAVFSQAKRLDLRTYCAFFCHIGQLRYLQTCSFD